jgi:tetratricopeptide (TPR) repeat protein
MDEQFEMAESFIDVGKYEKAVDILTELIEREKNSKAFYLRGYTYYCLNDFDKAIPDLQYACENDPEADLANYYLAQIHCLMANFDKAKECIENAIAINHENLEYLGDYITIEQSLKNYPHCIELCNQLLEEIPDSNFALNARGQAYMASGNLDAAIVDFNQAIKENQIDFAAFNNLGVALIKKGEYNKANQALQASLRLFQNSSDTFVNMGILLNKTGDNVKAIKYLDKAISMDITNPAGYLNRGIVNLSMNNIEAAKADLQRALELDFSKAYHDEINEYLQKV